MLAGAFFLQGFDLVDASRMTTALEISGKPRTNDPVHLFG
jgi:hypothetical protein